MKRQSFLIKLKKEGRLELIEPSNEICSSYLEKADNCLKSAKILLQNKLYENSTSEAYYAMYDSLLALLFKTGIKSENHSASILLLKQLFDRDNLFYSISFAKDERIDKQYYISKETLTRNSIKNIAYKAEEFIIQIKLLINNLNSEDIKKIRNKFKSLFDEEKC